VMIIVGIIRQAMGGGQSVKSQALSFGS
jgi:hypothetical protein